MTYSDDVRNEVEHQQLQGTAAGSQPSTVSIYGHYGF